MVNDLMLVSKKLFVYVCVADGNCVIPQKATKIETENWILSSFSELFRLSSPSHVHNHSKATCYIIPTRNWKVDRIGELGDGVLYQNNCDFDKKFDIENETKFQKSFNDCVTHCFNLTRCTHFSYSERNGMCSVKKASALTDREKAGRDIWCGYIPSRWNLTDDKTYNPRIADWVMALISLAVIAIVVLIGISIAAFFKYKVIVLIRL